MVAITQVLVAGLLTLAVQARPQPQAAQPSVTPTLAAVPAPSAAAPAPSQDDKDKLAALLLTAPSALQRFKRLLTSGGALLTGDALKKLVVFDFNAAKPTGDGGRVIAAVRFPNPLQPPEIH